MREDDPSDRGTSASHGAARRQSCSPAYAFGCTPARCSTVYR